MTPKNNVQVIIDGKMYTLSGYEGEDYLNKVAVYINNKLIEMKQEEGFRRQNKEVQNILMYLNIADDYYKIKKQTDMLNLELEDKNKELYDLKHEFINIQMKLENAEKEIERLNKKANEQEKNIIKLEAELSIEQKNHQKSMPEKTYDLPYQASQAPVMLHLPHSDDMSELTIEETEPWKEKKSADNIDEMDD